MDSHPKIMKQSDLRQLKEKKLRDGTNIRDCTEHIDSFMNSKNVKSFQTNINEEYK